MEVLYIEDNTLDRLAFERAIHQSYLPIHFTCAETLHEGRARIRSGDYDIIFVDLRLPDGSALDLIKELGNSGSDIVVLTGVSDISTAVQAIKCGAYDYIVKDVSREYLHTLPEYIKSLIKTRVPQFSENQSLEAAGSVSSVSPMGILIRDPGSGDILYYNSRFAKRGSLPPFCGTRISGQQCIDILNRMCSEYGLHSPTFLQDMTPGVDVIRSIHTSPDGNQVSLFSAFFSDPESGLRQILFFFDDGYDPLTASSDSLAVLASGIAHEMNNMLTSILGDLSLARQLIDPGGDYETSSFIRAEQAVFHGKDIACRLLTYADGGFPVVQRVPVRFLIQETLAFLNKGKSEIQVTIPDNTPALLVDPDLIKTTLRAVLMNAVEASAPVGSPIHIEVFGEEWMQAYERGKDEQFVRIEIRDQGSGMGPLIRNCAFKPFFTTKEGHLGLGLTSAKSIVSRHRGTITLSSPTDGGTVVCISLPVAPLLPRSLHVSSSREGKDSRRSEGTRVLVMDDEPGIREILELTFQKEGFHVDAFSCGEDAVKAVSEAYECLNPYQVAILDLNIPGGMGGKEAILEIKKICPSTLAIVSSGYSGESVSSRYAEYGFDASLPKPYNPKDMVHLVLSLITDYYENKKSE
jgi:DNA-binding response OmpR family regulator